MAIAVTCPICGKVLQANEAAAGRKAPCLQCGNVIHIPNLDMLPTIDGVVEAEEVRPESHRVNMANPHRGSVTALGRKPCPKCGEMVRHADAECPYCQEMLDPELRRGWIIAELLPLDEVLSSRELVFTMLCPVVGLVAGVIYLARRDPKGKKILIVTLFATVFWVALSVFRAAARSL